MGLLDFFLSDEDAHERKISKLEETVTNMYVQPSDREFAIKRLQNIGDEQAVEALLSRFEEQAPNTTVDIDEKQKVYEILVQMGQKNYAAVTEAIESYLLEKKEKINWPLKALVELSDEERFTEFVTQLLAGCDTDYERNPEKKQELLIRSAELQDPELAEQLKRFLDDDNETIRFLAVEALLAQDDEQMLEDVFLEYLPEEDSLRILRKLADTFTRHKEWKIPEDKQEAVELALPDEYGIHKHGHVYKKQN